MARPRGIAVLAPHLDMHYYYVGILAGIHEIARQHDVPVIAIKASQPHVICPPSLASDRVDGWLAIMHGEGLEAIARTAPLVTIGGAYRPDLNCPTVMPDNLGGTEALVRHLIDHGHRHIAFVGYLENPDIRQRYEGYQNALITHGIPLDPRLVCPCPMDGLGKHDGQEAAKRLIGLGLPCTAIVAGTDMLAIGAMEALKAAGLRVPEDVAVVGFDDLYIAQYTTPSLTTVRQPFEALGRSACGLLFDQIEGSPVSAGIRYISTVPVIRRSCGCHPAHADVPPMPARVMNPIAWRDALPRQLVDLANSGIAHEGTLPRQGWAGASDLVDGMAAALDNIDGSSPLALERAWHEVVARTVDLDTLQTLHTLLEQAGVEQLACGEHDPLAEARLQSFLNLSYVEMIRAYRARNIGRTSQIQRLIETNYEISTEISMWQGLGTGRGQRLAWLRHTPARWGCLARWIDREAGRNGSIVVTDIYTRDGSALVSAGATYSAASFPPDQLLQAPGEPDDPELIAIVPFQTPGQDWWLLAVRLTLETEFLTDRENLGMWTTLLGASLEREALLTSLTEQQERLRMANRELHVAKEIAEKADALKTRLLANVSHELRTPLDTILAYSEAALRVPNSYHAELPPGLDQDLRQIVSSSTHLVRLIDDLLDLSRAEVDALELFREPVDSRAHLQEVFLTFANRREAQNGVRWHMDMPARLPAIEADPVRLRQILFNLLSNARKFTEVGSIVLGAAATSSHLHIWVQDTGVGIPADLQANIFEPFVTTKDAQRRSTGIGLGLSITRRLVALHDGLLTLESRPGEGTTFHVYLPLPGHVEHTLRVFSAAEPAILVITARDEIAPGVAELGKRMAIPIRRFRADDDLADILTTVRPIAVAWDSTDAEHDAWPLVQRIRSHPQLCHIPFILGGEDTGPVPGGVTNVLLKPVSANTLTGMIQHLHPVSAIGPILVIDDDLQARELYQRAAAAALPGHPIRLADGGRAALQVLAHEVPSLVILDLMMPQVDGFMVLEQMRGAERTRAVPVLVMSGQMLSFDDIKRLAHARVIFHSKGTLSVDEMQATIQRALHGADGLPQPTSVLVKRSLAYLHQNYARMLTRQAIADAVGVNTHYLTRIFRQEQGFSPWEYLNRYRIKQAKDLLRTTDASITTIAAQVGFADLTYFGRVFHKHVGCSPRAFRDHPE